jgi:O-antigen ligase
MVLRSRARGGSVTDVFKEQQSENKNSFTIAVERFLSRLRRSALNRFGLTLEMVSIVGRASSERAAPLGRFELALTIVGGAFLFVVPMPHTVSLRLLALAFLVAASLVLAWRRGMPTLPLKLPWMLWAGLALLSLLWAVNPDYSIGEISNEIVYTFLAFFVFYSQTREPERWNVWIACLIAALFATSVAAISAWHAGDPISERRWVYSGVGAYTTFAVTAFPFLMLTAVEARSKILQGVLWLAALTVLVAALVGRNRMFWLALTASMVVFFGLAALRARDARSRSELLLLMLVIVTASVASFREVLAEHGGALADDPRWPLWRMAWDRFLEHPWLGQGFGLRSFYYAYPELTKVNGVYWHPHNLFLSYLTSMGLVGFSALVFLFFAIYRALWQVYQDRDIAIARLGAAGLAMVTGVLIKNMTDVFFLRDNSLVFWSLLGMTLGYAAYRKRAHTAAGG